MFISTLGHKNDKFVHAAFKSESVEDERGRAKKTSRFTPVQREIVNGHIDSFHPCISHYRRKHAPNRLYLDNALTVTAMYDDYKQKVPSNNHVSYSR